MFSTYKIIGQAIREAVPQILTIDLDKGQLDDPQSFESIMTPGILIGHSDITWSGNQGEGSVTVKLILRLPSRTHISDPLIDESLSDLSLAGDVDSAVTDVPGVLSSEKYSDYPSGTFYVVEQTYPISLVRGPSYVRKKVQVQVNPYLKTQAHA